MRASKLFFAVRVNNITGHKFHLCKSRKESDIDAYLSYKEDTIKFCYKKFYS